MEERKLVTVQPQPHPNSTPTVVESDKVISLNTH